MAWSRNGSTTRIVIIFATIITLSFFLLNIPGISKTQSNSIEALTLSKNIYQELMQQKDLLQHVSQFQASIHTNVSNGLNGLLGLEQFIPTLTDGMLKPRKQLPYNNRDSDLSNSLEKNDNLKSSQPYLSHHLHDTNPEYITQCGKTLKTWLISQNRLFFQSKVWKMVKKSVQNCYFVAFYFKEF